MCSSRKYPYPPPQRVVYSLSPHPPGFSVPEGFRLLPPTPWNFHDFFTWSPLPLIIIIIIEIYRNLYVALNL